MQTATVLVAIAFAVTSFPFMGHAQDTNPAYPSSGQHAPATPPDSPTGSQPPSGAPGYPGGASTPGASTPGTAPESTASPAETPSTAAASQAAPADLRPVSAELVSKLDTTTAKAGDDFVVQTKSPITTADGTQIPKGTKLTGHVVNVQSSAGGTNSQVAVQLDHAQLAGGQDVAIQSQIQSIGSAAAAAESSMPSSSAADRGGMSGGGAAAGSPAAGSDSAAGASPAQRSPGSAGGAAGAAGSMPAGTVVAHTGQIDIKTTSIPGVLVANNQPGQQDPRMAHASTVLLGAKKDVQLDSGTPMVIALATMPGSAAK